LLTNRDVLDPDAELKIVVECDKDAKDDHGARHGHRT